VTPKRVTYIPGIITNNGGVEFEFDCGSERSIGYFLEPLLIMSLFGKFEIKVTLVGYTNDGVDQSVDSIINCLVPLIKKFAPEWNPTLKINRRGYQPNATGKVYFHGNVVKYLKATDIMERGPIKKIRGVCSGAKVAPNLLNRLVSTCRATFNDYIPNVWIHTDFQKSQKGVDFSNGYSISLVAESTGGCLIAVDGEYMNTTDTPESVGEKVSLRLLDEIHYSGCIDTSNQQYALILMALAEKRLSQVRLGRLSLHTIETLRHLRDLIGVTFQIQRPSHLPEQE
jgi:RNA 3'-terminal phosphate cyclase-like protein